MHILKKRVATLLMVLSGLVACGIASAEAIVMNFDELNPNGEYVNDYYNGGCGGAYNGGTATCGGPNYGVVWSGNTLAGGAPGGLYNNTANSSSSPNVIDFNTGVAAFMNVAAGFSNGFSFYYAAVSSPGSIIVYSGLNGAGSVLATLNLPALGGGCGGFSQDYSCWAPIGVEFSGIAQSVGFGGTFSSNQGLIVFDDVTIGSAIAGGGGGVDVPEPAALGVFALGMLLIGLFAGLRRRFE